MSLSERSLFISELLVTLYDLSCWQLLAVSFCAVYMLLPIAILRDEPRPRVVLWSYPDQSKSIHSNKQLQRSILLRPLKWVAQTKVLHTWYVKSISEYAGARGTSSSKIMLIGTTMCGSLQIVLAMGLNVAGLCSYGRMWVLVVGGLSCLTIGFAESALVWNQSDVTINKELNSVKRINSQQQLVLQQQQQQQYPQSQPENHNNINGHNQDSTLRHRINNTNSIDNNPTPINGNGNGTGSNNKSKSIKLKSINGNSSNSNSSSISSEKRSKRSRASSARSPSRTRTTAADSLINNQLNIGGDVGPAQAAELSRITGDIHLPGLHALPVPHLPVQNTDSYTEADIDNEAQEKTVRSVLHILGAILMIGCNFTSSVLMENGWEERRLSAILAWIALISFSLFSIIQWLSGNFDGEMPELLNSSNIFPLSISRLFKCPQRNNTNWHSSNILIRLLGPKPSLPLIGLLFISIELISFASIVACVPMEVRKHYYNSLGY